MPKSRLLNNTNNHFDEKEFLIPNQHEKKSSETNHVTSYAKSSNAPHQLDVNGGSSGAIKAATTTAPPLNRSSSRSLTKRPVSSTASSAANVKPNTILSLEDRDIVVIDNADYKESTSNESTVIVVEKPRKLHPKATGDIDLAELLTETNWPASAGDLALALNNRTGGNSGGIAAPYNFSSGSTSTSNSSISCQQATGMYAIERNRSKNPLSHIGQSKITKRNASNNTNHFVTTGNLINLDSDGSSESNSKKDESSDYQKAQSKAALLAPTTSSAVTKSDHLIKLNLDIGSMVEITRENCENIYGVIRWIGNLPCTKCLMVGVELEDELPTQSVDDGMINGVRLFTCPPGRALFVEPEQCTVDRRFQDVKPPSQSQYESERKAAENFGHIDCPIIQGSMSPLKFVKLQELEKVSGKFKGIQGHYNSCYLDATLFAMFTFTCVFDSLLFRPADPQDIASYTEVQKVLREEIVNPLRKNLFVRADRVMKLRQLLERLSSVTGLTCEEKDPEEFLNSLLTQIMRAEPFLKLNSGQDAFYYQLFVEKDERLNFPTVQQLFEQSFLASDIKLKEVPSCLIIQMPRFGKNFKMYPRILPSQVLDVTDIIEGSPRQCCVCGKLAELECKQCYGSLQFGAGLETTSFCRTCLDKVHSHDRRTNHIPQELKVPHDFLIMAEHISVPRIFMELFAVVCIETSHYVAFVKCGSGADAPWCFFDSMADRKGEQNGYNIPEVVSVPNLPLWLSEDGSKELNERYLSDKSLPEHAKRLFCDGYMCMYQTDVMMYR
ncbi:ubiquitin carboxyl-terminal hydrolase CYLD [Contarinia nasturtii]|uniref:ubiquitin carboxyl-terminal hydrolase CYLD n=1 Tax=Contarinia nasturtii TaxID=265458 RepID=UPI0012D3F4E9|nr:ubiquitin carboxyl-terminal hydrolase CYLD [Contarinia nasturtii]